MSDTRETTQRFETEAEAIAFIEGLEYGANEYLSYEGPYEDNGQFAVDVREFC